MTLIDVYHPLVEGDHEPSCASLCTNFDQERGDNFSIEDLAFYGTPEVQSEFYGCRDQHACWCPDGALTWFQFQSRHPDVARAEA